MLHLLRTSKLYNLKYFSKSINGGDLFIESNDIIEFLEIKDISGKLVLEMFPQKNKVHIQTSQF